jgi:hypothetical protein
VSFLTFFCPDQLFNQQGLRFREANIVAREKIAALDSKTNVPGEDFKEPKVICFLPNFDATLSDGLILHRITCRVAKGV